MNEQTTLQKALYTIKKLKHLLQEQQTNAFEPVAIIGLSCRFPQAIGKEGYWEMLKEGRNIISKIPEKRWELLEGSEEALLRDRTHPYWGGFMSDIDHFDAYYFGISPREAIRIDPQHRLLLEVAHEAIEDAGLPLEALAGTNTGVFSSLYVSQLAHLQKMDTEMDALYLPTGNAMSIAANRISYLFDLRGPSVIIDSACSSSMTSLYLACLNIQKKACDLALVCGAKLNLLPYINFVLTKAKMLSPDGQCKTFDAEANGYVQGEGVGVVVLKPLSQALKDKDQIYAVITGSAINQDGRTNGLTAPNGLQQELLLNTAYKTANIPPQDISYVECHGTGTFLGDPIEIQALGEVLGKNREKTQPCWIGSVKTNIGHLEPAAGIASIIKVALGLKYGQIPPHLNFSQPNPHIAFDKYNLRVPTTLQSWPKYGNFRVAGLSGFGFGGANAHLVMRDLADYEKNTDASPAVKHPLELFTVSGKNLLALKELVGRWCHHLENNPALELAEICYNSHVRRTHHSHRLAIIAATKNELLQQLRCVNEDKQVDPNSVFMWDEKNSKTHKKITQPELATLELTTLATLYVNNASVDWRQFEATRSYAHIEMPLYPWQHKAYWPPLGTKSHVQTAATTHPLQGRRLYSPLETIQFAFTVSNELLPDLKDTYNIVHAGYYLEIMAFAVKEIFKETPFVIEDHKFLSPIIVPNNNTMTVQLVLNPTDEGDYAFQFYSSTTEQMNWVKNATGKLCRAREVIANRESIDIIKKRCAINEAADKLYARVIAMGMPAGESIRWTHQYWLGDQEILCEFQQPTDVSQNDKYTLKIHPGVFDASIQPLFQVLPPELNKPYIASGAQKLYFSGVKKGPLYLWAKLKEIENNGEKIWGNCWLMNAEGEVVASFQDICLTQLDNKIQIEELLKAKTHISTADLDALPLLERKKYVTDFLITQIAIIFSLPKEDISSHSSLRDLGIDSLMALVLMRAIEVGLEKSYAMQGLLEGPTINELANHLIGHAEASPQHVNPWIAYRIKQPNAKTRLFCFPYGGGGASIYRDWQEQLGDTIEVCPIQLPGREERMGEAPLNDLMKVVNILTEQLQQELDLPFAFFGHSFGSLLAFELIRNLRRKNLPTPKHLFVSAFPDPRVPTKSLDTLLEQLKTINIRLEDINNSVAIDQLTPQQLNQLSRIFNENGIMGYGDYLQDREIIKVLLPIFMGDMGMVKSYNYYDDLPLEIPITVFAGKLDTWVAYEDHLEWKMHTKDECEIIEFESGHMFIKEASFKKRMLNKIRSELIEFSVEQVT
ncbi:MAG: polyketide synthase dehydratase domain-containing protein [Gammaproteobacteria bacterium]|nr:polyketide synthase dehydratase domain-containing protein [Gammaproteobacteria bacterium]